MSLLRVTLLASTLPLFAGAAFAHDLSNGGSDTLGDAVGSGRMSQSAAEQFVSGSGYSLDEAQSMSLNRIAHAKWGNT